MSEALHHPLEGGNQEALPRLLGKHGAVDREAHIQRREAHAVLDADAREDPERDEQFLGWCRKKGCSSKTIPEAHKEVVDQNLRWAAVLTNGLQDGDQKLQHLMKAILFRILMAIVQRYDPISENLGEHNPDFHAHAEPYVRGAVLQSLQASRCVVSRTPTAEELEAYKEGVPA